MDPEVVGLILARGGSQGIPLKNIRKLHGQPLILRTLRCLIDFGRFSAIWVSTDHPEIEACVRASALPSVEIFRRSGEHAHHAASSVSAVWEFLQAHPEIHRVALIQCTSPFLDVNHLERAWALICRVGLGQGPTKRYSPHQFSLS